MDSVVGDGDYIQNNDISDINNSDYDDRTSSLENVKEMMSNTFRIPKKQRIINEDLITANSECAISSITRSSDSNFGNLSTKADYSNQNKERARRRINLSEYMSKKNRQPLNSSHTVREKFANIDPISKLNSALTPLDTRALTNTEQNNSCTQFYTDILDSLRSEDEKNVIDDVCKPDIDVGDDTDEDVIMTCDFDASCISNPNVKDSGSLMTTLHTIPSNNTPSNSGILCLPGFSRSTKKSVSWADESGNDLESIKFIGGQHHKNDGQHSGMSIGKFEMQIERNMRLLGCDVKQQTSFFANNSSNERKYGPFLCVELPSHIQLPVIQSKEREIQNERHKKTLQNIFLPCVTMPDTPAEPDCLLISDQDERNNIDCIEPKDIPLEEIQVEDEEMPIESTTITPVEPSISVPPSLPPELAELLVRAHQNNNIPLPKSSAQSSLVNKIVNTTSTVTLPPNAINLLKQLRSMLQHDIVKTDNTTLSDKDSRQLDNNLTQASPSFPVPTSIPVTVSNNLVTTCVEYNQVAVNESQMTQALSQNPIQQPSTHLVDKQQYPPFNVLTNTLIGESLPNIQNSSSALIECSTSSVAGNIITTTSAVTTGPLLCPRSHWNNNRGPYPVRVRHPPYMLRGAGRPRYPHVAIINPWTNFQRMPSSQFTNNDITHGVSVSNIRASNQYQRHIQLNQRVHPQRFQHRINFEQRSRFNQPSIRFSRRAYGRQNNSNNTRKPINNNVNVSSSNGTGEWL